MKSKKFLAIAGIFSLAIMSLSLAAIGATSADVTATVTPGIVSVSVADGSVAYGTVLLDTIRTTALGDGDSIDDTQTATNSGTVSVNLGVRSSDAVGAPSWNLAAVSGSDAFYHGFCTTTCDSLPIWNAFNVDNTTYSSLAAGVAASGSQVFDLKITTPTSSTDSGAHTITVTVQATAI